MHQLTIDDIVTTRKRTSDQVDAGKTINILGGRMEVIISNEDVIVLYCLRKEKVYPLRFVDGCFAKRVP